MHSEDTDRSDRVTGQDIGAEQSASSHNADPRINRPTPCEQPFQEIANQMQIIIDAVPDAICFKDGEGRWQLANEFCLNLFQLAGVDYRGKTDCELADYSEFYRDVFVNCRDTDERAWQAGVMSRMDEVLPTPDGTVRVFDVIKLPTFYPDGCRKDLVVIGRDITDRKKAQEDTIKAIAETERFFTIVPDLVCVASTDGHFKKLNPAWEEVLGYTTDELLSRPLAEFIHPDDIEPTFREIQRQIEGDNTIDFVNRYRCKDGSYRWLEWRATPAENGELLYAVARDITERLVAEEAVKTSEENYRMLFENMTAAFILHEMIYDEQGRPVDYRFVEINPAFEKLTGFPASTLLGKTVRETHPHVAQQWVESYAKLVQTGESVAYEAFSDDYGRHYDIWAFSPARDTFATVFTDITDRKRAEEAVRESEENFRGIYENAPVGIFRSTLEGRLISANPIAARMFGYDSPEEIVEAGRNIAQALFVDPEKRRDIVQRALESEGYCQTENEYRRKDGSTFTANLNMRAVCKNGEVAYVEGFVEDITERKRAEEDKRALEQCLEEHKRKFYRETIFSVTDGKLDICDAAEVEPHIASAQLCTDICEPQDVGQARREIEAMFRDMGIDEERLTAFAIASGEAITNALKHATKGRAYAGKMGDEIWVGVVDEGPGIESLVLPGAVLRRGFSTKPSMGLGYSIMLDTCDRILLKTDPSGTTVILIIRLHAIAPSLDSVPDTW